MAHQAGRHFLQIPGPTNVPDRVLRAIDRPVIDHRGPAFAELSLRVLDKLKQVFRTEDPVIVFPSSGTGAWEAALVNTLSPGDRVLMYESGQFATLWRDMAIGLGLQPSFIDSDWRTAPDPSRIEAALRADRDHVVKAVCIVHSDTSTGLAADIRAVREAIDRAAHPALLMVDAVSSLGSLEYRHADWRVDVTVAGSQKGLMLPAGLGFNAVSQRAIAAADSARLPRSYWDWRPMLAMNVRGYFPYTPATNLLYGLDEALSMLLEEGLDNVVARHARHAEATRAAVRAWGLDVLPHKASDCSNSVTTILAPSGVDPDKLRALVLDEFDMSLGASLGKVQGKVFRIGHLGDFNDLTLMGTLAGIEMGLRLAGYRLAGSGVAAAMDHLVASRTAAETRAAA